MKVGRGGGTYAHSDIAMEFASWILADVEHTQVVNYKNGTNRLSQ